MNVKTVSVDNAPTSITLAQYLSDLKRRRNAAKLSQTDVAEAMDVSYQSVNRWENTSFTNATVSNLIAYLKVLEANGVNTEI